MTTIKSYTDIEQSKKLAEILPIESADMRIGNYVGKSGKVDGTNVHYYPKGESFGAPEIIYAWSLAALMGVLPKIGAEEPMIRKIYYANNPKERYICQYSLTVMTNEYDNPIDACYEMVLRLHELKQSKASKVEEAMRDVEQKAKAFTEAHAGETSDEILAQMRGVWTDGITVPRWVLENVEDTLRIQHNIYLEGNRKETCQVRNVIRDLNCVRKLLGGIELTGSERTEKLIDYEVILTNNQNN